MTHFEDFEVWSTQPFELPEFLDRGLEWRKESRWVAHADGYRIIVDTLETEPSGDIERFLEKPRYVGYVTYLDLTETYKRPDPDVVHRTCRTLAANARGVWRLRRWSLPEKRVRNVLPALFSTKDGNATLITEISVCSTEELFMLLISGAVFDSKHNMVKPTDLEHDVMQSIGFILTSRGFSPSLLPNALKFEPESSDACPECGSVVVKHSNHVKHLWRQRTYMLYYNLCSECQYSWISNDPWLAAWRLNEMGSTQHKPDDVWHDMLLMPPNST